jgi:molybdate transport system substrate-binding protein
MRAATGIYAMTMLAFVGAVGFADAAEIRVYTTGAPAEAVKSIAANFSSQTGHRLTFTVGQPAIVEGDLAAGDKADVVILPSPVIAKLSGSGALRAGSAVDLARVGIGVVVRVGGKRPDISNSAAVRKMLLEARTIVYPDPGSGGGTAGLAIERMIERMGIADAVKQKLTRVAAIGGGVALVADGKADVGIFNISEILPVKNATLVGPLPSDLQNYIVFGAAIPKSNATPEPAASFIKALASPTANQAWQKAGMEPVAAAP